MTTNWKNIFEKSGQKAVTRTDKAKSAYVLNSDQLKAVRAAGIKPADTRPGSPFDITLLIETARSVQATFYFSERAGSGRPPEPRLGREFITSWLNEGDQVVIGNIGNQLYAVRATGDATELNVAASVAERADEATKERLITRAKQASGKPERRVVSRNDFVRNPTVVMGAIARADGSCEMPACIAQLFTRDDDVPYLEVHHITPLSEGGEDSLLNAAALCPRCHRELHHGKNRMGMRAVLASHIASLS